jgi:mRNA-degrading endonuclease toxin of MazEF toxin-antitoxin module
MLRNGDAAQIMTLDRDALSSRVAPVPTDVMSAVARRLRLVLDA